MSKTLIINSAIVLAVLILGGSFYAVQVNKQQSIERQQQIALEAEEKATLEKKLEEETKEHERVEVGGLEYCKKEALKLYIEDWNKTCKTLGKLSSYCWQLNENAEEVFNKKKNEAEPYEIGYYDDYYAKLSACSCQLIGEENKLINEHLKTQTDECNKIWNKE